jgi:magnesium-transporting ATPase (P-type)
MAGRGQRVIACAMLELSASDSPQGSVFTVEDFPSENLVFLGLLALQDPPKPGTHTIHNTQQTIANKCTYLRMHTHTAVPLIKHATP